MGPLAEWRHIHRGLAQRRLAWPGLASPVRLHPCTPPPFAHPPAPRAAAVDKLTVQGRLCASAGVGQCTGARLRCSSCRPPRVHAPTRAHWARARARARADKPGAALGPVAHAHAPGPRRASRLLSPCLPLGPAAKEWGANGGSACSFAGEARLSPRAGTAQHGSQRAPARRSAGCLGLDRDHRRQVLVAGRAQLLLELVLGGLDDAHLGGGGQGREGGGGECEHGAPSFLQLDNDYYVHLIEGSEGHGGAARARGERG